MIERRWIQYGCALATDPSPQGNQYERRSATVELEAVS